MNFIKNLKKKVYILPIVFVFILTSCISNTNFLPTQTFASSQIPTASSTKEVTETPTSQIITKRPEDKFLFVEVWLQIEGVGKVPETLIDRPGYYFNSETLELSYKRNNKEELLSSSDFGFIGQGRSLHGTSGGGIASGITIIKNFPFPIDMVVATGNINEQGVGEYTVTPVVFLSVLSDGTLMIEINNQLINLYPNQPLVFTKEIFFSSEKYNGKTISVSSIKNYGWLSIELINP